MNAEDALFLPKEIHIEVPFTCIGELAASIVESSSQENKEEKHANAEAKKVDVQQVEAKKALATTELIGQFDHHFNEMFDSEKSKLVASLQDDASAASGADDAKKKGKKKARSSYTTQSKHKQLQLILQYCRSLTTILKQDHE